MAREILFRGKRKDNGEWIYGDLRQWSETSMGICDRDLKHTFPVRPETVGQFTGLTDQYGAKIWEGDIIRYMDDDEISIGVIRFGEYQDFNIGFNIEWLSPNAVDFFRRDIRFWTVCREITVIGNIHDNPELLNGTES